MSAEVQKELGKGIRDVHPEQSALGRELIRHGGVSPCRQVGDCATHYTFHCCAASV